MRNQSRTCKKPVRQKTPDDWRTRRPRDDEGVKRRGREEGHLRDTMCAKARTTTRTMTIHTFEPTHHRRTSLEKSQKRRGGIGEGLGHLGAKNEVIGIAHP